MFTYSVTEVPNNQYSKNLEGIIFRIRWSYPMILALNADCIIDVDVCSV